jgi:hypothetical protein
MAAQTGKSRPNLPRTKLWYLLLMSIFIAIPVPETPYKRLLPLGPVLRYRHAAQAAESLSCRSRAPESFAGRITAIGIEI